MTYPPDFSAFHNQVVRDLAWVLFSPTLLQRSDPFIDVQTLVRDVETVSKRLAELDRNPRELSEFLQGRSSHRLGHYFERLVHFWLVADPSRELLAHNVQVSDGKQTVGEFDFLLKDLETGQHEHWEVAIKLYLGTAGPAWADWVGPNPRDTLASKMNRLTHRQIRLGFRPAGQNTLQQLGIGPVTPRILVKGHLFVPLQVQHDPFHPWPYAGGSRHASGWWVRIREWNPSDHETWALLNRDEWLSEAVITDSKRIVRGLELRKQLLERFRDKDHPAMVVRVQEHPDDFRETERGFVVPDHWPNL